MWWHTDKYTKLYRGPRRQLKRGEGDAKLLAKMPRRSSLFWDVDPKKIDPRKNARYVIGRIMDFGNDKDVQWMYQAYPHELLYDVTKKSRGIRPKSRLFWKALIKTKR